jgi:predicted ABC-class ATPase
LSSSKIREVAFRDYLTRDFRTTIGEIAKQKRGTGHSGEIHIDSGGQEILERNSIVVTNSFIEARFCIGLPAAGRRVLARQAGAMLFDEVPKIVDRALRYGSVNPSELRRHIESAEDQDYMRRQLESAGLVAFVGNGSILPRRSGVDDRPLRDADGTPVVPFQSPPELEVTLKCPNRGEVSGLGIPRGVTLFVGGGYHGKSTVLRAIETGIYNHIPGDGRELTVSTPSAVKIRAEDGRYVENVNISPFIADLPFGRQTRNFSTENASGSTSQAANIVEALETGSRLLLIDEDTSATNFIIRDARMQALVAKSKEPITPFLDKVRQLFSEHRVSTLLVMGGAGDYFDVADHIIMMDSYEARSVTEEARQVVREFPSTRVQEGTTAFGSVRQRFPEATSFDPSRGRRDVKIDTKGLRTILFGRSQIDLTSLEQLVDQSQTRAIGRAILFFARRYASQGLSLGEGLQQLERELDLYGLDLLIPFKTGNLARPRIQEIAFAINRLRTLRAPPVGADR